MCLMRQLLFLLVLASWCSLFTGCGGCGGSLEAQMKARQRKMPEPTGVAQAPAAASPESGDGELVSPSAEKNVLPPGAQSPVPMLMPESAVADEGGYSKAETEEVPEKPRDEWTDVDRRAQSIKNLEKISHALQAYVKKRGRLPPSEYAIDGSPYLSWRVLILEELGYPELRARFQDEPWNSKNNLLLLDYMPPEYQSPERTDKKTNYLAVTGGQSAFWSTSGVALNQLKDGADNTVAIVEVDDQYAQEWTKPSEYFPPPDTPASWIYGLRGEGAFGVMASGRVVLLPREMPASRLAAFFTGMGGEPVGSAAELAVPTAEPPPPMLATVTDDPTVANQGVPLETEGATAGEGIPAAPAGPRVFPGTETYTADLGKQEIPDEESLAKAREQLKLLFGDRFEKAKTRDQRRQFVQDLLAEASNVEQNASDYHELLRIARDLAASIGDADSALAACELLETRFQLDPLVDRLAILEKLLKSAGDSTASETASQEALHLYWDAFEKDRYEVAIPLSEVALGFARKKVERREIARLQAEHDSLLAARSLYVAAQKAFEKLKGNSADAAANEAVGRYLCFVKNRWEAGLPYLNRAHDLNLRGMATLELSTSRTPHETLALADQYWDLADKSKPPQRRGLHLRSVHCYAAIQLLLATSLDKVKVTRRLEEARNLYGPEQIDPIIAPFRARTAVDGLNES
jgi:hypothetical protein